MKSCPNCGKELDEEMIASGACDHCGEAFEAVEEESEDEDEESDEEEDEEEKEEDDE